MSSKSSIIEALEGPASGPAPAASEPIRGAAPPVRGGRWRWWLGISCGLIGVGLLAIVVWRELHPRDLAAAEAAYRRNDLVKALRLAEAHLARRPGSRSASLL